MIESRLAYDLVISDQCKSKPITKSSLELSAMSDHHTHHLNNDRKYSGDGSFFICCWYRVADISLHQQSGEATLENRIKRVGSGNGARVTIL